MVVFLGKIYLGTRINPDVYQFFFDFGSRFSVLNSVTTLIYIFIYIVLQTSRISMTAYVKIYKDPISARPVISHRNTPMSRSCKWAADALAPCVGRISQVHIKDTRDFHDRIKRSGARGRLVSFDFKSLFTNIPVEEVISHQGLFHRHTPPI